MLSPKAKQRGIHAIYLGDGLTIGLFAGTSEESDRNYARQPVQFVDGDDPGTMTNANEVRFPPYAMDGSRDLTSWAIFDADGDQVSMDPIHDARGMPVQRAPEMAERPVFAVGDLVVRYGD